MASKIIRVTLFKIPLVENQNKLVDLYKIVSATAVKDGKPYLLSLEVGPLVEDARSQGYTFAAKTEFANKEDMTYYDEECKAHAALKAGAKDFGIQGLMMVYYPPAFSSLS